MVLASNLEERVDRNVVHLIEDLEGLYEIPPKASILQKSQSTFFKFFLVSPTQTPYLIAQPSFEQIPELRCLFPAMDSMTGLHIRGSSGPGSYTT